MAVVKFVSLINAHLSQSQAVFLRVLFPRQKWFVQILAIASFLVPTAAAMAQTDTQATTEGNTQVNNQADASNTGTPQDIQSIEAQLKNTAVRLQALDEQLQANRTRKASLKEAVNSVSGKVSERQTRLDELDNEITRYNGSLKKLEAQVLEEHNLLNTRKDILANALRQSQRIATGTGLRVVLQHENPSQASRLGVYTDFFLRAQNQLITQQLAIINKVEQAHETALKDRNWLNHIQRKASSQHQAFVKERQEVSTEIDQVEADIQTTTKNVAELKADNARLQTLMEELKALQVANSGYFAAGRGSYEMPVNGQIHAKFNDVKSVGKVRWQGLFITAKPGAAVRAVADGEVVYSDWLQGFGRLVIIDHGDSFMTLYGGNRETLVSTGDWVDSGRPLATVGNSSGHKLSGLYFEIRHEAKPVDPEQWINLPVGTATARK